jgi:hypothetical protein
MVVQAVGDAAAVASARAVLRELRWKGTPPASMPASHA